MYFLAAGHDETPIQMETLTLNLTHYDIADFEWTMEPNRGLENCYRGALTEAN